MAPILALAEVAEPLLPRVQVVPSIVTFNPLTPGSFSNSISLGYFNGIGSQTLTLPISGTGTNLASLAITDYPISYYNQYGVDPDGPTMNYGLQGINTSQDHTFTVTNTGGATATALTGVSLGSSFAYKGSVFPGTGGTCGNSSLAAGAACTIVVTFTPATTGLKSTSVGLNYAGGSSAQTLRPVIGTGTSTAVLTVYDMENNGAGLNIGATYDYSSRGVSTTTDHTFYVFNSGGGPAGALGGNVPAGFLFKGGIFPGTGGTCTAGSTLPAGSNCTLVVTFNPLSPGLYSGPVDVSYFDGSNTLTASRTASETGTFNALLVVSEHNSSNGPEGFSFDFGIHGLNVQTEQTFYIRNTGASTASSINSNSLSGQFVFKGGTFPGTGGTCINFGTLNPGSTCSVRVVFTPTSSGAHSTYLTVAYFDSSTSTSSQRAIAGTETSLALLEVTDNRNNGGGDCGDDDCAYDFGTVGSPRAHKFFITNNGARLNF